MLHFSLSNDSICLWRLDTMLFLHHMLILPQLFLPTRCLWLCCPPQNWLLAWDNERGFQLLFYLAFSKILQALVVKLLYRYEYIFNQIVFTRCNSLLGIKLNSTFPGHVGLIRVECALMRVLLRYLCLIWQTAQRQTSDPSVQELIHCLSAINSWASGSG